MVMAESALTELQTEYYSLLNGNITYSGSNVAIYEEVPVSPSYPYIQFQGYTSVDDSTKSAFGDEITFSLQIVDRFGGNFGSRASVYSVLNDIKGLLRTRPSNAFQLTNFRVITTIVDNELFRKERTDTYTYYIIELRFRHKVEEI